MAKGLCGHSIARRMSSSFRCQKTENSVDFKTMPYSTVSSEF